MRKYSLFALILAASLCANAQKKKTVNANLPAFGVVDKSELEIKECNYDSKAEALVLVDEGDLDFIYGSGMEMKRRLRIKILNDKGLDWANVHLQYLSERNAQNISSLEAQTYNLDPSGNVVVTKLEKQLVYEKKLNKKYTEKAFTFPNVKVGSIIEYKFKHTGIGLVDWYFQRAIPVRYSHFVVDFPQEIEVAISPYCSHKYEWRNENKSTRVVQTFSMSNVPAFRDEPFIVNEDFYRDRLETKVTALNFNGRRTDRVANWVQVIKFLMEDEDFGVQIKKNIPRTAELDAKLKTVSAPYERMKTIYNYVQQNMEWNEYTGIWALDGVKSAWKDKKGTVGEINLILVNLLKDADLVAHPILVSSHNNGIVNTADAGTYDYPGFHQFNKVMAYVEIGKKSYVLDASQKNIPVNLIPLDVLLTEGLVIEKIDTYEWGWKNLWNEGLSSRNVLMINSAIDEEGKMKGEASIASFDYARLSRLGAVKKGKDEFIKTYLSEANPGIMVDDVTFENIEIDSLPLIQKIKFNEALNTAGDFKYFSANILTGLEKNPFVADSRMSDIFFGYNQNYTINGSFTLAEGYEFDVLPKNIKMILPDTSIVISRMSAVNGNTLQTRITLDFKKPIYTSDHYSELQEFYQRLFELLNEQFVIKKKA